MIKSALLSSRPVLFLFAVVLALTAFATSPTSAEAQAHQRDPDSGALVYGNTYTAAEARCVGRSLAVRLKNGGFTIRVENKQTPNGRLLLTARTAQDGSRPYDRLSVYEEVSPNRFAVIFLMERLSADGASSYLDLKSYNFYLYGIRQTDQYCVRNF